MPRDAQNPPFAEGSFDVVTNVESSPCSRNREMARHAGDNGQYVERFASDILQCRTHDVARAWDDAIWQMVRV